MSAATVHADNAAQAEYWNSVAGRRWTDRQEEQDLVLRPVSDRLIAAVDPRPGERSHRHWLRLRRDDDRLRRSRQPRRRSAGARLSEPMLARARERAPQSLPIRFELADATVYDFEPERADLVASRFGVMFFADPARSFANLRQGLKPGGRLAFACWREASKTPSSSCRCAKPASMPLPCPKWSLEAPGPFAFADPARVRRILSQAGYADIDLKPHDLELDIAVGRGLDTAVKAAMMIGPTSRMLDGQSEAVRAAAAADIRKALAAHARGDSVPLGAAIWIVTATNPAR